MHNVDRSNSGVLKQSIAKPSLDLVYAIMAIMLCRELSYGLANSFLARGQ